MTDYYPIKKAFPLTREELRKLSVGDTIVLGNRRTVKVRSVGRRWLQTDHLHVRIDLNTGLCEPSTTGYSNDHPVFRSIEDVDIVQYNSTFVHRTCTRLRELLSNPHRISIEQAIALDCVLKGMGIKP